MSSNLPTNYEPFTFGNEDAVPIPGDWDGDGITEIGVFRRGEWYLDINGNGVWDEDDLWAKLGSVGDLPVVGDWDGDGTDTIGLFDPAMSRFYLRNSNTTGVADIAVSFGPGGSGWTPITGDWDGS